MRPLYADMSPGIGWNGRQPEAMEAATATTVAPRTAVAFEVLGVAALALHPRPIVILVGGSNPSHAPTTATIVGTERVTLPDATKDDVARTEVLTLQTANGVRVAGATPSAINWSAVTSIAFSAAGGTSATTSIGFGLIPGVKDLRGVAIETWLESFPDRQRPGMLNVLAMNNIITAGSSNVDGMLGAPHGNYTVPFGLPPSDEISRYAYDFCIAEAGKFKPTVFVVDHSAIRKDTERALEKMRASARGTGESPPDPATNNGGAVYPSPALSYGKPKFMPNMSTGRSRFGIF